MGGASAGSLEVAMALKDGSPEDYEASAIRHYKDAAALAAGEKLDNAGHLIGFAVECAIKHKIGILGEGELKQHLPDILPAARKRLGSRQNFVGMFNLIKGDVLAGWQVDQRYSQNNYVTRERFDDWQRQAQRILGAGGLKLR